MIGATDDDFDRDFMNDARVLLRDDEGFFDHARDFGAALLSISSSLSVDEAGDENFTLVTLAAIASVVEVTDEDDGRYVFGDTPRLILSDT